MEKRGLTAAVAAAGLTATSHLAHLDEMRLGLHGTTRRVWGRRGVKVIQPRQFTYQWTYLVVIVDHHAGCLWWCWVESMAAGHLLGVVRGIQQQTTIDGVVWDGAPSHRDERVTALGLPLVALPPYSPELNPAERVLEEIRRHVEGQVYATLEDKQAAVDAFLTELDADPERVRRLTTWHWIQDACAHLPTEQFPDRSAA